MEAYEKYISTMKRLKATPPYMGETDFKIAHGIKDETNSKAFTLAPKRNDRQKAASLETFIKEAESSKRKRSVRIAEALPKKILAEIKPPKTNRIMSPKISLKEMTEEEKRAHKLKLNREWKRKRYPPKLLPPPMTIEEKRAKQRERYHKNKPTITRIFYKDLTEDQLKAHLKEQRRLHTIKTKDKRKEYAEKNKEKRKEYARQWNIDNKEKREAINKKYKEKNKEKVRERSKAWNDKNPEKRKKIQAKANAKRRNKQPKDSQKSSQTEAETLSA